MSERPERAALACPDKFRGSLTAPEAARATAAGLQRAGFTSVHALPLADGGEGTLDALLAARGGRRRSVRVTGPLGDPVDAEYGVLPDGTAVIEMAQASGLALTGGTNFPLDATTKGTGELIAAAARAGAERLVVGVGGSATTDGGLGALEALGWSLRGLDVTVACDVTTPFLDAARVFGPQKGASANEVELLARRLERLADDLKARTGVDVTEVPGAGAAGGLAGGLLAAGARLESGFDVVARAAGLDEVLDAVDLVVTGEGRLDRASFEGKVVGGVTRWARAAGVAHLGIVCGSIEDSARGLIPPDVLFDTLTDRAFDEADAQARAALLLEEAAFEIGRRVIDPALGGGG
ncbi:MAG: glycerate kinase [Actinobacteria bacterium]|nr:glycerate kinase [Actinomycetota bacterium]